MYCPPTKNHFTLVRLPYSTKMLSLKCQSGLSWVHQPTRAVASWELNLQTTHPLHSTPLIKMPDCNLGSTQLKWPFLLHFTLLATMRDPAAFFSSSWCLSLQYGKSENPQWIKQRKITCYVTDNEENNKIIPKILYQSSTSICPHVDLLGTGCCWT